MLTAGISVKYVGKHFAGSSERGLRQTLEALTEQSGDTHIITALSELTEGHDRTASLLRGQGRYVLGTTGYGGGLHDADAPMLGLLYAEGEGELENGGFSVLRMATWVSSALHEGRVASSTEPLAATLVSLSLRDVADPEYQDFGVPVERGTIIGSFDVDDPTSYRYGHEQDVRALGQLELPVGLKEALAITMADWHQTEFAQP